MYSSRVNIQRPFHFRKSSQLSPALLSLQGKKSYPELKPGENSEIQPSKKNMRFTWIYIYLLGIYGDLPMIKPKSNQLYTSSAAQGGGGSFKNRKPIGEVGCCESGMAKRIH